MEKKDKEEKAVPLTYHFSADGNLTGVTYDGAIDAATHAKIKDAVLAVRDIAKGR